MAVVVAALALFTVGSAQAQAAPRTCTIVGTPGADVLRGTSHADVLCGRGGDDVIAGGGGNDVLRGGGGNDRLRGDAGRDVLVGGRGADLLIPARGDQLRRDRADLDPNYVAKYVVRVLNGAGVTLEASQGSESHCINDPSHGQYPLDSDDWPLELVYSRTWVGQCFFDAAWNSWLLSRNGVAMGEIRIDTKGEGYQVGVTCDNDAWHTGSCVVDDDGSTRVYVQGGPDQ